MSTHNRILQTKTPSIKNLCLLITCLLAFVQSSLAQYDIPEKPEFIPPIIDSTQTLNNREFTYLYNKLKNYNDSTSTEVMIVIIPSTKGENIGLLAPKWGQKWGIGQAKEDNGVFVLLAKNDRKIWISPGYGVEDKLTAGITGEIIRNHIIPEFKTDNYFEGLDKGTDVIFDVLNGSYQNNKAVGNTDFPFGFFLIMFIVFIILIIAISKNRRNDNHKNGGKKSRANNILEAIILSNMGRGSYNSGSSGGFGGFGGGSSGGGGFGGFGGGGGFSGGGAGGSW